MSKKSRGSKIEKERGKNGVWSGVPEGTRHGILAITSFVIATLFILASIGKAGFLGNTIYQWFRFLLGIGYFLVPMVFLMLGIAFLKSIDRRFPLIRIFGSVIFIFSGLGIIEVVETNQGGMIGRLISNPLLKLFDTYASIIVLGALFIISVIVIFEARISLKPLVLWWTRLHSKRSELENIEPATIVEPENPEEPEEFEQPTEDQKSRERAEQKKASRSETFSDNQEHSDVLFDKKAAFAAFKNLGKVFTPPPLSLLERDKGKPVVGDINFNKNTIKRTLANFGINVEMDEISIGPSVTRYALKPAEGVKLSRIVALQNDMALALAAHPIRIEAPIPGK